MIDLLDIEIGLNEWAVEDGMKTDAEEKFRPHEEGGLEIGTRVGIVKY